MSRDDAETYERARRTVAHLAAKGFARHVITEEGEGRWLCHTPGTGVYSFRVVTAPGTSWCSGTRRTRSCG